jgi:hypothetical protein
MKPFVVVGKHGIIWIAIVSGGAAVALRLMPAPEAATPAPVPTPLSVPVQLEPGAGATLAETVSARGVQVYECTATRRDVERYEWVLVGPKADLFNASGTKVGWHDEGPRWHANDGSAILGVVKGRADAPVSGAIPWLLLSATSVGEAGRLSHVKNVQRVNTYGGAAPVVGCSVLTLGALARERYRADYRFFSDQGAGGPQVP